MRARTLPAIRPSRTGHRARDEGAATHASVASPTHCSWLATARLQPWSVRSFLASLSDCWI